MSGVIVMRELMLASADIVDMVTEDKIFGDVAPEGTVPPFLTIEHIAGTDRKTLVSQSTVRVSELVQVKVHAADATDRLALIQLVRRAGRQRTGDFAEVTAVSVTTEGQGPDFTDAAGIKVRTQDFRVSFNEPA